MSKCIDFVCACLVVIGIVVVGCECEAPWWPWLNVAGCVVFAAGLLILNRRSKNEASTGIYNRRDHQVYRSGVSGNSVRKDRVAA